MAGRASYIVHVTLVPTTPLRAAHLGDDVWVPFMSRWCFLSKQVSAGGRPEPRSAGCTATEKKAQQAPHPLQGLGLADNGSLVIPASPG